MHYVNPSYILAINKCSLATSYCVLFNKLGWENSVFKIDEGREGVRAILNELRIANFPELLMSSLSEWTLWHADQIESDVHAYACPFKNITHSCTRLFYKLFTSLLAI